MDRLLGEGPINHGSQKEKVIYARVSSSKQKADLDRQVEELKCSYPEHVVYKDIGSGLNYKRQRFTALLERVYRGVVSEIIVAYRDRLCRYGFELVQSLCSFHGTKSWFTMPRRQMVAINPKSQKISWPSVISSLHGTAAGEEVEEKKDSGLRAKRVKLNPSPA